MNIQNFCNYLEQIGMIDQNSINNFLSIFSLISQKKKLNNNNKISTSSIYVNALSSYLKNILSIDDNFKIFAHKIIKKYSQNLLIKQYSSINTMIIIFTNRLNIEKYSCFLHLKKISDLKIRNKRNFDIKKSLSLQNLYPTKEEEYYLQTKSSDINTSNYLNYSNFMNNKPKNKITAQTMFLKKQNQLMNKIRKEHNIKFKRPRINNLSCEPRKKYIFFDENGNSNKYNLYNNLYESRNSSNNININSNASDFFNGNSYRKVNNKHFFDFSNYFSNNI